MTDISLDELPAYIEGLQSEIERLRKMVIRAAQFCDYATLDDSLEFGIRCCCGTRDFEPHKEDCEFGQELEKFKKEST